MSFKTKQEFHINIIAINDREAVVIVQDTSTWVLNKREKSGAWTSAPVQRYLNVL